MSPTMKTTNTLLAALRASHPEITFETVEKADTAHADDDRYASTLIGVVAQDVMIVDPFESSCGRFVADPMRDHGIPEAAANAILAHNTGAGQHTPSSP